MNPNYWESPEKDTLIYRNCNNTLVTIEKITHITSDWIYEGKITIESGVTHTHWDANLNRLMGTMVSYFCQTCGKRRKRYLDHGMCEDCEDKAVENYKTLKEQRYKDEVLDRIEALEEKVVQLTEKLLEGSKLIVLITKELSRISEKSKKRKTST